MAYNKVIQNKIFCWAQCVKWWLNIKVLSINNALLHVPLISTWSVSSVRQVRTEMALHLLFKRKLSVSTTTSSRSPLFVPLSQTPFVLEFNALHLKQEHKLQYMSWWQWRQFRGHFSWQSSVLSHCHWSTSLTCLLFCKVKDCKRTQAPWGQRCIFSTPE